MLKRLERAYETLPPSLGWFIEARYWRIESKINFVLSRLGLARPRWIDGYAHEALDDFINSTFARLGLSYRYRFLAFDKVYLDMCLSTAHEILSDKREGMLMTGALPDALIDANAALRQVEIWQKQSETTTIDTDMVQHALDYQRLTIVDDSQNEFDYLPAPARWF